MQANSAEFTNLPINQINVQEGFNPRKFFDNYEFQQLVVSVQAEGVIQPIIVRPVADGNGYWVVAGERRWRAANEAGLTEIPAVVRNLSDKEARLIATVENSQRADMSPAEEAEAARDVLTDCGGDKTEALRLLGWSAVKFDARLLLLHAAPEVLTALTERKIKLGHAELLSQLPSDFQTATLAKILENGYSVAELKSRLASFALELSKASFDKTGCNGCPHNSCMQSSLFEEHISEGRCANRACYEQKTEAAMLEKKAVLSEQYAVVYLDSERTPNSFKVICQSGVEGVGKSQFDKGCKQCAHFGALLSTLPDRLGKVTEDCCFNLDCHKEKVAEYQASTKAASTTNKGSESSKPSEKQASTGAATPTKASDKTASKDDGKTETSAAAIPGRVVEKIEAFYREQGAKQVASSKLAVLCINTYAMYRLVRSSIPSDMIPKAFNYGRYGSEIDEFIKAFTELGAEETLDFNHKLLNHLLGEHEKGTPILNKAWAKGGASVLNVTKSNLAEHFILDREFLGAFTKSGIEGVLREAVNGEGKSFVEHYESHGDKNKMASLMKRKNNEILDDVFGCGYDFSGFVPTCVSSFMGEDKQQGNGAVIPVQQVVVEPAQMIEPVTENAESSSESDIEACSESDEESTNAADKNEPTLGNESDTDELDFIDSAPTTVSDEESEILDAVMAREESSQPSDEGSHSDYLSHDWLEDDAETTGDEYTQNPDEEEQDNSYV